MGRFEGAKKLEKKEARMGFSLGERLKAAGIEVAKSEVREAAESDKAEVASVGSVAKSSEVQHINKEAEQALDANMESTEIKLEEVAEKSSDAEVTNEVLEKKESLEQAVAKIMADAEEAEIQIKGLQEVVDDAIANGGVVPKSLRKLLQSYEEGGARLEALVSGLNNLATGILSIDPTEEKITESLAALQGSSVQFGEFRKSFQSEVEQKIKALKIDAEKMAERGDFEVEGAVEKLVYLNEIFFTDVKSLTQGCADPSKYDQIQGADEPRVDQKTGVGAEPSVGEETELNTIVEAELAENAYDTLTNDRKTLRGGFVPRVIEGGKGKTEVAETGPTGTLVDDESEMASNAGVSITPDLLKDIPYPSPDDRKNTVGLAYLTQEEMEEFGEVPSGASRKVDDTVVEKEEPLTLRELMDIQEQEPAPEPSVGEEDVDTLIEFDQEKMLKERELMDLLNVFEGVSEIGKEDRDRIIANGENLLQEYAHEYGDEEKQKMAEKWVDKLGELLDDTNARNVASVKNASSPFLEGASAAAGAVAVAKAIEIGGETLREGDDYRDKGNDGGSFDDTIITKDFTRAYWGELTLEEQNRILELYSEIDNQEHDLGNLKNAKNAMERALRVQYGDQFEVSARAQKTLREKSNQIHKLEVLILRNKNEQRLLKEKAQERLKERQGTIESVVQNISGWRDADKAWESEEFPAKTSWWKEHSKMRKEAIVGGVVGGAGLFAGAWVASKLLTPIIHPFKTLEFLGNATDKFFKFLDRFLVKGDPLGAISDTVKSAEKFFDDKMHNAGNKAKDKSRKKVKYSTTE